jgi:hypothetical protein
MINFRTVSVDMSSLRDRLRSHEFIEATGGGIVLDVEDREEDFRGWAVEGGNYSHSGGNPVAAAAAGATVGTAGTLAATIAAMMGTTPPAGGPDPVVPPVAGAPDPPVVPPAGAPTGIDLDAEIARLQALINNIDAEIAAIQNVATPAANLTPDQRNQIDNLTRQRALFQEAIDVLRRASTGTAATGTPTSITSKVANPTHILDVIPYDASSLAQFQEKIDEKKVSYKGELTEARTKYDRLLANSEATELEKAVAKDEITALENKINTLEEGAFIDIMGDRYHMAKHRILSNKLEVITFDVNVVDVLDVSELVPSLESVMSFQQFLINYGIRPHNRVDASDSDILPQILLSFKKFFNVDTKKRKPAECTSEVITYVFPYLVYRRGTLARNVMMYTDEEGILYPTGQHFYKLYEAFNTLINKIQASCGTVSEEREIGEAERALLGKGVQSPDIMKKLEEILREVRALKGCTSIRDCLNDPQTKELIKSMLLEALRGLTPEQLGALRGPAAVPAAVPAAGPAAPTEDSQQLKDILRFLQLTLSADDPQPVGVFSMTPGNTNANFYNITNSMGNVLRRRGTSSNNLRILMNIILTSIGTDVNSDTFRSIDALLIDTLNPAAPAAALTRENKLKILANAIRSAQHTLGYFTRAAGTQTLLKPLPIQLGNVMTKIGAGEGQRIASTIAPGDTDPFIFSVQAAIISGDIKTNLGFRGSTRLLPKRFYAVTPSTDADSTVAINSNTQADSHGTTLVNYIKSNSVIKPDRAEATSIYVLTKRQIEIYMLAAMRQYILNYVEPAERDALALIALAPPPIIEVAQDAIMSGLAAAAAAAATLTAATTTTAAAATTV